MTPTLFGRWQTRVFLTWVLGALPTALYMSLFGAFDSATPWKLAVILGYAVAFGLGWDGVYTALQKLRWDRDWPYAFQFAGGLVEGLVLFALFRAEVLPGAPYQPGDAVRFAMHYGTVFLVGWAFLLGPVRVVFPRWRFRGGRIV